ncbi:MAG: GlsB/YeaQ/YmgE family stress response membrane protein [Bacteroidota bacterium]
MSTEQLLSLLVVGVAAGFLTGKFTRGAGFGLIGDLIIGVIGSFIGAWLFGLLGISVGGVLGAYVAAIAGALLLLYALRRARSG